MFSDACGSNCLVAESAIFVVVFNVDVCSRTAAEREKESKQKRRHQEKVLLQQSDICSDHD